MKRRLVTSVICLTMLSASGFAAVDDNGRAVLQTLLAHHRLREAGLYASQRAFAAHARGLQQRPHVCGVVNFFQGLVEIELGNNSAAEAFFEKACTQLSRDDDIGRSAYLWLTAIRKGREWLDDQPASPLTVRIGHSLFRQHGSETSDSEANVFDFAAGYVSGGPERKPLSESVLSSCMSPRVILLVKEEVTEDDYDFEIRLHDPAVFRIGLNVAVMKALVQVPDSASAHRRIRLWGAMLADRYETAQNSLSGIREPVADRRIIPELDCITAVLNRRTTFSNESVAEEVVLSSGVNDSTWQLRAMSLLPLSTQSPLNHACKVVRSQVGNESPFAKRFVVPKKPQDVDVVRSRMEFYWEVAWMFRCWALTSESAAATGRFRSDLSQAMTISEQLVSPLILSAQNQMTPLMHIMNIDINIRNQEWELWQTHVSPDLRRELPAIAVLLNDARVVAGDRRLGTEDLWTDSASETAEALLKGYGPAGEDFASRSVPEAVATTVAAQTAGSSWSWLPWPRACFVVVALGVGWLVFVRGRRGRRQNDGVQ